MNASHEAHENLSRRAFLGNVGLGLGGLGLASLLDPAFGQGAPSAPTDPLAPRLPHFAPRARRVIYLHMAGSPSQLELFQPKPKLGELDAQPCPDSLLKGKRFAFIKGVPKMLGTPYRFARRGESGIWMSELLPHLATVADEITVVNSLHTDQFNHAPAQMLIHTGSPRIGRPSMGSWVTYGLGSENENLPGFVVLVSGKVPSSGKSVWGSGFLPSVYQGVQCRTQGDPVLYLGDPEGMDRETRRRSLDALKDLNEVQLQDVGDPETRTRIAQYELAFRMQTAVPEAMDIAREPESIRELYGSRPGESSFANNCLLARRLVERGVRFVQLYDWGWDHHGSSKGDDILNALPARMRAVDRPMTALVKDLRARGLLDDTLIIWGGEFGRTPMRENRNTAGFVGRDHHPYAFSMWMAGGGLARGLSYGETDDIGYYVTENPVHVHDLQATLLHLLGFNHERLTYTFQGRRFRLTDVHGQVVPALLA